MEPIQWPILLKGAQIGTHQGAYFMKGCNGCNPSGGAIHERVYLMKPIRPVLAPNKRRIGFQRVDLPANRSGKW
jgi:hypothetical protein